MLLWCGLGGGDLGLSRRGEDGLECVCVFSWCCMLLMWLSRGELGGELSSLVEVPVIKMY